MRTYPMPMKIKVKSEKAEDWGMKLGIAGGGNGDGLI